jgi:hypothetical protein
VLNLLASLVQNVNTDAEDRNLGAEEASREDKIARWKAEAAGGRRAGSFGRAHAAVNADVAASDTNGAAIETGVAVSGTEVEGGSKAAKRRILIVDDHVVNQVEFVSWCAVI